MTCEKVWQQDPLDVRRGSVSKDRGHQTVGLVLPGGGARGAYQAGALKAVAEIVSGNSNPFPVIMGASVGAINAVALASHSLEFKQGVARIVDFWSSLTTGDVYRTDLPTILKDGARWLVSLTPLSNLGVTRPRSVLDNSPLGDLLRKKIDFDGVHKAIEAGVLRAVGVTASSYDRARAITFFQGVKGLEEWVRVRRDGVAVKLEIDHLLASAALPFVFSAQRIGNENYGDGSLRLTSPLSPAIHCGADRILVIGVRDAKPLPARTSAPIYPNLGSLSGYMLDMIFMDNLDADIERALRVDHTLSLLQREQRVATQLRDIDVLIVQPSRDVRDIARDHAHEMPWSIRMLLKRLGVWGRDWRLPSYLLFEPGYCRALIELGYQDTIDRRREIAEFISVSEGLSDDTS
jgi:NTE family protein